MLSSYIGLTHFHWSKLLLCLFASLVKAMNSTPAPMLRKSVLVFFDDTLVYNASYQEHLVHLEQVFQIL
jgi:hypothetical protein